MKKWTVFMLMVTLISLVLAGCGGKTEAPKVSFPTKAVTIVIPYAAGGGSDLSIRSIADNMGKLLGQPLVVMNKPGAGGAIAVAEVSKAKADGYTMVNGSIGNITIAPYLNKVNYTPEDLKPVAQTINVPIVLAVHKDSPIKTIKDFVEYAKKNPGKVRFGSPGSGSIQQIVMESFGQGQGIKTMHMPFEGANPAMAALLGGHIESVCLPSGEVTGQYKSGLVRVLGVTTTKRFEYMPDVPTFKEQGYDVDSGVWYGVLAPKGTPDDVVKKLAEAIKKSSEDPKVLAAWKKLYLIPDYLGPDEFSAKIKKEAEKHKKILKDVGLVK